MSPTLLNLRSVRGYLRRHCLVSVPEAGNCLALTFDDGPNPRNTPKLLDLLSRKSIAATFFVLGRRLARFSSIARETHAQGHELGNHGYHHIPMAYLPRFMIRREVERTDRWISEITGNSARFFRPPMGHFSNRTLDVLDQLGYRAVLGTIHPEDSRQPGTEVLLDRIRPRIEPGAIIILHDGGWRATVDRSQTIEVVDRLTDELGAKGYRFLTVSQLAEAGAKPT